MVPGIGQKLFDRLAQQLYVGRLPPTPGFLTRPKTWEVESLRPGKNERGSSRPRSRRTNSVAPPSLEDLFKLHPRR